VKKMLNKTKMKWPWRGRPRVWPARMRDGSPWPRVTVITPSYNQGRFIEETILSVLQQGYPNLEFMILDGGSTDNTVEIIRKYEQSLAYWVSEPDHGQSHALNKGLKRATGDIIGWLNSDDMYAEDCFQKVMDAFAGNPDALAVHGNRILLDADSHVSGWAQPPAFDPEVTGFVVCSETAFWRRAATAGAGFNEDLRFAMDLDFFCRLYKPRKFIKLDSFIGYFRCYGDNKSSTLREVCLHESEREWKKIFGEDHEGWRNSPKRRKFVHALSLIRHPRAIAFPYLYRRLILRKRGL
jgi:glycosyltransferase involved in cell wall biosynthesis